MTWFAVGASLAAMVANIGMQVAKPTGAEGAGTGSMAGGLTGLINSLSSGVSGASSVAPSEAGAQQLPMTLPGTQTPPSIDPGFAQMGQPSMAPNIMPMGPTEPSFQYQQGPGAIPSIMNPSPNAGNWQYQPQGMGLTGGNTAASGPPGSIPPAQPPNPYQAAIAGMGPVMQALIMRPRQQEQQTQSKGGGYGVPQATANVQGQPLVQRANPMARYAAMLRGM